MDIDGDSSADVKGTDVKAANVQVAGVKSMDVNLPSANVDDKKTLKDPGTRIVLAMASLRYECLRQISGVI